MQVKVISLSLLPVQKELVTYCYSFLLHLIFTSFLSFTPFFASFFADSHCALRKVTYSCYSGLLVGGGDGGGCLRD